MPIQDRHEFEVEGRRYRTGKLAARAQFHVIRRLGPIAGPILKMVMAGKRPDATSINPQDILDFVEAFSAMEDEQVDYVLDHCLAVVNVSQGEGWPSIMSSDGKTLIFKDIGFHEQAAIVGNVIWFNYAEVFQKAQATLKGAVAR